jgi:hypothetical protein
MAHTHTWEIEIDGFVIEGECQFAIDGPSLKTSLPINMHTRKVKKILDFLRCGAELTQEYGEIQKIEIKKIGYVE